MKPKYKILRYIIYAELFVLFVLRAYNVTVQSWLGNAIAMFIVLLPPEILLFLLGKDENISESKRGICKFVFWFLAFCYCGGGIMTFLGTYSYI